MKDLKLDLEVIRKTTAVYRQMDGVLEEEQQNLTQLIGTFLESWREKQKMRLKGGMKR